MRNDLIVFGIGSIIAVILLIYILPLVNIADQNYNVKSYTYANMNYLCSSGYASTLVLNSNVNADQLTLICARANQLQFLSYAGMIIGGILLIAGLFLAEQKRRY